MFGKVGVVKLKHLDFLIVNCRSENLSLCGYLSINTSGDGQLYNYLVLNKRISKA